MIYVLEFLLAAIALSVFATFVARAIRGDKINKVAAERVESYIRTIRRTGKPNHLNAMSDPELTDVLIAAMRRQQSFRGTQTAVMAATFIAAFGTAIYVATGEGFLGFGITLVLGAITAFGINQVLVRQNADWFNQRELDQDRLTID